MLKIYAKASTGETSPRKVDILVPSVSKQTDCRCCDAETLAKSAALLAVRKEIWYFVYVNGQAVMVDG